MASIDDIITTETLRTELDTGDSEATIDALVDTRLDGRSWVVWKLQREDASKLIVPESKTKGCQYQCQKRGDRLINAYT